MEWYYAEGGAQRGPVNEEAWRGLVDSGVIKPETLVWHDGMADWKPFSELGRSSPGQGGLVCSQCGKAFPPEQVIRYGEQWVCAGCKPLFLQRVREGVGPLSGTGLVTEEQLLARDYQVDVGGSLRASWDLLNANAGQMVGVTMLVGLAYFAMNIIPYLSILIALVLGGPLAGGVWYYFIRKVRSEPATVEDAFKGFGPRFGQLALVNVVWVLLTWVCMAPFFAVIFTAGFSAAQVGGGAPAMSASLGVLLGVALLLSMVCALYLTTIWFFAFPLVMDKGMRFWPAMQLSRRVVSKRPGGTLLLFLVAFLLYVGGFLLCCVGLLAAGPLIMGMLAHHYQRVFGDLQSQA